MSAWDICLPRYPKKTNAATDCAIPWNSPAPELVLVFGTGSEKNGWNAGLAVSRVTILVM
jgi:hypothetical protein